MVIEVIPGIYLCFYIWDTRSLYSTCISYG